MTIHLIGVGNKLERVILLSVDIFKGCWDDLDIVLVRHGILSIVVSLCLKGKSGREERGGHDV